MADGIVVDVLLFARLRELCDNHSRISVELTDGASAATCFEALVARFPAVEKLRPSLVVAINEEYSGWERTLRPGDAVSFIPPVSGG